jgi:hypothetical protein
MLSAAGNEKVPVITRGDVQGLWSKFFPDVPLTEPSWFEECDLALLAQALAIAADKDKAGRFNVRNQDNIGRYVNAVIRKLGLKAWAAGVNLEVTVVMKFAYRITDADKVRLQAKLVRNGDCLLFGGGVGTGGYGRFHCNEKLVGAHVFAFFAHHVGHLPTQGELGKLQIAHTKECLSRTCCNPTHLRLTTRSVNLSERVYGAMKEGQLSEYWHGLERW